MPGSSICVGLDEAKPSIAALKFAIAEASRRGAAVSVVTSWAPEEYGNYGIGMTTDEQEEGEGAIKRGQRAAIELALAEYGGKRPTIVQNIVQSIGPHPGHDLVTASRACDLLVVGTEYHSILKEATAGSTSKYCIRHATVPVVVVPNDDTVVASNEPPR